MRLLLIIVFLGTALVAPQFSCLVFAADQVAGPEVPDLLQEEEAVPDLLAEEDSWADDDKDANEEDDLATAAIYDPLEPMNRFFFEVNDTLYDWVMKPVTDTYSWLLPQDLRDCFGNFFDNIAMPIRLLNSLLQADFETSGVVLGRFFINSTLGVYGLVDIAADKYKIMPRKADFGQTLGRWGVEEGIFLYLPFMGPMNIRDGIGFIADAYTHPIPYIHDSFLLDTAYYSTTKVNSLSLNPDLYDDLRKYSLDPYVASRQAYYDYRRALVERQWGETPRF